MIKIVTDEKLIDEILERGVESIFPSKEELKKKLMSGEKIKLYCGYDPSAPSLQIGNAVLINKQAQFQALGHEVIFLIGDFTGMIGDPTDKGAARKKMTREEVLINAADYQKQASGYLNFSNDNAARIMYNSEWLDKITFRDLIEITSNFTAQQMIARDMFQGRIKESKPIFFHEFLYPIAQAYDSVAMDVDLEIGGNDQMFNMMCGRDLMKVLNKKEKFVLTMKLLADEKGKKVGKTEGNAIFLNESPENMYGQVMAWSDGLIGIGFELCTKVPYEEVREIYRQLENQDTNPRDLKMKLAYEITKINHGEEKANEAQDYFIKTIQKKELPEVVAEVKLSKPENIGDFLVMANLSASKSDARRKIEQGGVSIDGDIIKDFKFIVDKEQENKILKVGKKDFRKIVF
ncbi:MAG TPA: tyrosine--tRNA ligase [Patescibacteria group bacterium]|nr:tyrosine--tRNA ligase [Patescibacteria group bacterium]